MKTSDISIAFQEVPDEISLCISFTGCRIACKDCHSKETWNPDCGESFNTSKLEELLNRYKDLISCVCFFGGEWSLLELKQYVCMAKKTGVKIALYTGIKESDFNWELGEHFDYIKLGPFVSSLGGLKSMNTNQKFFKKTKNGWENITYKFWR